MSLRANPIEQTASLPDGREAVVRVGIATDPYLPDREVDTVAVELVVDDRVVVSVNTVLNPEQDAEARELAREIVEGLEAGRLEPTAAAIEPLADRIL